MLANDAVRHFAKSLIDGGIENGKMEALWLVCYVLNVSKETLFTKDIVIEKTQLETIEKGITKRLSGYPFQYIIGDTEFYSLKFLVRSGVLIPRNDTEILVEKVVQYIGDKDLKVLDLCCGSGCIGISIKANCKNATVTCGDISDTALQLTADNAKLNGVNIKIIKTDMFKNISGEFDVIVSNPPYIPTKDINALQKEISYEPVLALDGMEDGLYFYKDIRQNAKKHLNPHGQIFLEIGYNQGVDVCSMFKEAKIIKDLCGNDRVIIVKMVD